MTVMMRDRQELRVEMMSENLYRVSEFRRWVQSNVLFPIVSDSVVHPLLSQLKEVEHELVKFLYDNNSLAKVTAMQKTLVK